MGDGDIDRDENAIAKYEQNNISLAAQRPKPQQSGSLARDGKA